MSEKTFRALVVSETETGTYSRAIQDTPISALPQGEVLIQVHYSSLNYKDALSASGNKGVTRKYPHTPGIDAAGVVTDCINDQFKPGDRVIVTSYDLGMNTAGGFGQYIRVPAQWVVRCPEQMSLRESMCYGTAGFTAALSVHQLIAHGVSPEKGEILVSGATGGVGSLAVAILAKLGYSVTAINGVKDSSTYLQQIGAKNIISIDEATDTSGRPMLKSLWAGSIDAVGGEILATTIKSLNNGGTVTSCGHIASPELPLSVFPFILRGVNLLGIDSQNCPMELRQQMWNQLATAWKVPGIEEMIREETLDELDQRITMMLNRKHKGRVLIRVADAL